jgi:hypothetical protein
VPFVRFSRDKRGYEYVFLVDVPPQQANSRARVLYWYRTPPGMKVGRQPFDEAVRQALEGQYPDLKFDWKQIVETPMPPAELTINWRERRRTERAVKRARMQDELDAVQADTAAAEGESHTDDAGHGDDAANGSGQPRQQVSESGAPKHPAGRRRRRRSRGRSPDTAAIQTSGPAYANAPAGLAGNRSESSASEGGPEPQHQGESGQPVENAEHNGSDPDEHSTDQDG